MSGIDPIQVSPLIACIATGIIAMLLDAFASRRAAAWFGGLGLLVATGLAVWQSFTATERIGDLVLLGGGVSAAWSIMAFTAALAVIGGIPDLSARKGGGGMVVLITLATAASMVLSCSVDLLLTLIALETIAVAGYALVVAGRTARSAEAGMKYVIQGALATGLFMAGLAIHVGVTAGGTELRSVLVGMPQNTLPSTVATVFILAAFAFKLGAAPFHSWAPDAFETAPPSAGAFMASTPKIGALLGLIVLFAAVVEPVAKDIPTLSSLVLFATLAVGSILVGNLAGLRQQSYLRMLGYSGVAQVGYALVGVATGSNALAAVVLLISVYAVAAVGAFTFAQFVAARRPGWDGSIAGMAGIGKQYPFAGVCLAVVMLSLTGIPLTAGFWGKLYVFTYAVGAGLEWLVLVAVLGSVVSFGYYGAVLRSAFFEDAPVVPAEESTGESDADESAASDEVDAGIATAPTLLALALCALAIVVVGVLPFLSGLTPFLEFFAFA